MSIILFWDGERGTWKGTGIPRGNDLYQHYVAGQIVREGDSGKLYHDSYFQQRQSGVDKPEFKFNYVYSPLVARIAAFSMQTKFETCFNIWFSLSIISALATAFFIRASGVKAEHVWLLVLGFPSFFFALLLGQTTPMGLMILAGSGMLLARNRPLLSGLILSGLFFKPQIVPYIGLVFLFMGQWRFVLGIFIGGIFWIFMTILAGGWTEFYDWIHVLRDVSAGGQSLNYLLSVTWGAFFRTLGLPYGWLNSVGIVVMALVGLALGNRRVSSVEVLYVSAAVALPWMPYAMSYEILMALPAVLVLNDLRKGRVDGFVVIAMWIIALFSHQIYQVQIAFVAPFLTACTLWILWRVIARERLIATEFTRS